MKYFIYSLNQECDLEQAVKNGLTENVFQVAIYESRLLKKFIWFLLQRDISFEKSAIGAGITLLFVDCTMTFFVNKKEKKS